MKLIFCEGKDKKQLYLIYLAEIFFLLIYHLFLSRTEDGDFILRFQMAQRLAIVCFVCSIFLSYEMFCDLQKKEWRENLLLEESGWRKVLLAKSVLMLELVAIAFFVVLCVEFFNLSKCGSFALLWKHVLRVILLNYGLFPLMGISLGKMFALISKKRWNGYLGILIVVLLGCGIFGKINTALYLTVGINLDSIFHFFQFEQPNTTWMVDYVYLVPAENYRFFLFGAWIAGSEAITFCKIFRNFSVKYNNSSGSVTLRRRRSMSSTQAVAGKKKNSVFYVNRRALQCYATVGCTILCVIFALEVITAGNYENYDLNYATPASKETEFINDDLPDAIPPDFTVKTCSMELHVSNELTVDAVLTLGKKSEGTYHFTLYRGYKLTSVQDESRNDLTYERNLDYITIQANRDISEIHMSYHGYNQSFYSNSYGIMLPGFFAYYPQPGFRPVFDYQVVDGSVYSGFHVSEDDLAETMYEIHMDYGKTVYSNLSSENGTLEGVTKAPTLIAGMVTEDYRTDGHYIYPLLLDTSEISLDEIKSSLAEYSRILGIETDSFETIEQVIFVPISVYTANTWGQFVILDNCLLLGTDQVTADADELALETLRQYLNVQGEKAYLEEVMFSCLRDALYLQDLDVLSEDAFFAVTYDSNNLESEKYEMLLTDAIFDRMYLTLQEKYGKETVAQYTVQYLQDKDSTQNMAEFMQSLYRELEGKEK
jgi:hypothetical protein